MLPLLLRLLFLAAIIYIAWRLMNPKATVRIVMRDYRVQRMEGLAKSREHDVLRFLESDLEFDGKLEIRARRRPDGYLWLAVSGRIEPGTRQRIRNFLNTVM